MRTLLVQLGGGVEGQVSVPCPHPPVTLKCTGWSGTTGLPATIFISSTEKVIGRLIGQFDTIALQSAVHDAPGT